MESWRISEDGTQWTFKLRQGVRFHNGELATIEDALFSSVRSIADDDIPEQATPTQTVEYRQISKQEITGPDELAITFNAPYAGAAVWRSDGHAGNLRMNLLPSKLLGEPYEETEPAYESAPIL
jgi:ABC-type transport system substrate-binding protein